MKRGVFAVLFVAILAVGVAFPLYFQNAQNPGSVMQSGSHPSAPYPAGQDAPASKELDVAYDGQDQLGESTLASDGVGEIEDPSGLSYSQKTIIVGLRDGVTVSELNSRLATLDYIATKEVSDEDVAFGYVSLELAEGVTEKSAEALIERENIVEGAQPNYVYHLAEGEASPSSLISGVIAQAEAVNDARASEQWALEAVNAYDAWSIAKTEHAVTVAVVDNGCLTTHEDLQNNIVAQYDAVSGSENVTAQNGSHGTHVCGIVAAEANNGVGVAGVSYNAGLLPINVFEGSSAETMELLTAYDYILKHASEFNVKVVNMSLGCAIDVDSASNSVMDESDVALVAAVRKAYESGILTVCSAGNDVGSMLTFNKDGESYTKRINGAYVNYPSDWLSCALSVIASNSENERASYSNYNKAGQMTKDIMAPGGQGNSNSSKILSSIPSGYGYLYGTSMAAPCVSGIAALVFAVNPNLKAGEVANILCSTAQDMNRSKNLSSNSTFDLETGYGLVDAAAAVKVAKERAGDSTSLSNATISLSATSYTYNGSARKPTPTVSVNGVTLSRGEDYTVEYSHNTNAGTASVTVAGAEGSGYIGSKTVTFSIKPASLSSMSLSATSYTYDKKTKSPKVTVTGPKNGKTGQTLTAGVDYTLTTPSGRMNAGTYTYKAVAKSSNYTGALTKKLTIKKAAIKSVSLSAKSYTYNDSAKKPSVTVKGSNSLTLKSGTDYSVAYKNNKAVGKASVTVSGKGNYFGTKTVTFTITKRANTMKASSSVKKVKFRALKKARQLLNPISVKSARGKVTYVKKGGSKYLAVNKSTGKVAVSKGIRRGTYKTNVRVSAAGTSTYKAVSKTVKVEVKVV